MLPLGSSLPTIAEGWPDGVETTSEDSIRIRGFEDPSAGLLIILVIVKFVLSIPRVTHQ